MEGKESFETTAFAEHQELLEGDKTRDFLRTAGKVLLGVTGGLFAATLANELNVLPENISQIVESTIARAGNISAMISYGGGFISGLSALLVTKPGKEIEQ
jgi:hypothetical protein